MRTETINAIVQVVSQYNMTGDKGQIKEDLETILKGDVDVKPRTVIEERIKQLKNKRWLIKNLNNEYIKVASQIEVLRWVLGEWNEKKRTALLI